MVGPTARVPFVIGVTGNIACGKSAVMTMLAELGADPIDADRLYHDLIAPGQPLVAHIRKRFGGEVIDGSGGIDRAALGRIVFADSQSLGELEAISHPAVIAAAYERIANSDRPVVAIDAVKLVESGLVRVCDQLWLVVCDPAVQRQRLIARGRMTGEDADRRLTAQPPLESKRATADLIIDNSGDFDQTRRQVQVGWARLPILPS